MRFSFTKISVNRRWQSTVLSHSIARSQKTFQGISAEQNVSESSLPTTKNATSSTKVGSTIWALWSCTTPFSSACTNPHWEIGRGHDEPPNTCNTMTFVNNNWWTQEFGDTFPWELKLTPAKMSFESVDLVLASVSPTGFFWGIGRAVFVSGALLASAPSVFCFCFSPG